jgi:hypothetical protein
MSLDGNIERSATIVSVACKNMELWHVRLESSVNLGRSRESGRVCPNKRLAVSHAAEMVPCSCPVTHKFTCSPAPLETPHHH